MQYEVGELNERNYKPVDGYIIKRTEDQRATTEP